MGHGQQPPRLAKVPHQQRQPQPPPSGSGSDALLLGHRCGGASPQRPHRGVDSPGGEAEGRSAEGHAGGGGHLPLIELQHEPG